ncbi:GNAT family N-acetyltransferase [Streptosporangium sp. G11]|uniref:GNAT family N-acetyltransferase n=1 Tax=Streptosporangium sp. G11 TaxID=3436926 RepID=UPI003EBF47B0
MIIIRRATPDDAATVYDLICGLAEHQDQGWGVTVSVEDLKRQLARPEVGCLIAERDGHSIGYVSWLQRVSFWSGQDYLHLDDLYVTGAERGNGAGEQLMRAIAEAAEGKVIRWEVAEANVAAQRFYARIGATLASKKIGRWQPA